MDPTLDRWMDAVRVIGPAAVVAGGLALLGDPVTVGPLVVGGVVGAWVVSPWSLVGPHTPHREALPTAGPDDVVIYWRPGCTVCLVLAARLTAAQRRAATWVNVVRDHDAALFVRDHRGGDMVTPTAVTGGGRLVTADAATLGPLLDAR